MASADNSPSDTPRPGRQPSTSVGELSHVALQLFIERGFDQTTVDDIAQAVGIGRRTFFRYFASKNDLPWGDFDRLVERMRDYLDSLPAERPLLDALREAVIEFNRFPADEVPYHRQRMALLLNVPTLVAHSTLRYTTWRQTIADFAAKRLGVPADGLQPQAIAWTFLAVSLTAYEQWLQHEDSDLSELLDRAFLVLDEVFQHTPPPTP
jgi:mycofactocin system transcriptional regulator